MAPGATESDVDLQGWIDTLRLEQIFNFQCGFCVFLSQFKLLFASVSYFQDGLLIPSCLNTIWHINLTTPPALFFLRFLCKMDTLSLVVTPFDFHPSEN